MQYWNIKINDKFYIVAIYILSLRCLLLNSSFSLIEGLISFVYSASNTLRYMMFFRVLCNCVEYETSYCTFLSDDEVKVYNIQKGYMQVQSTV